MALKFNIHAEPFVPSGLSAAGRFEPIKSKKHHTKPPKYRSKNGELWMPPKGWLPFYRCQACHEVMSKKDATKCPQQITSCGHITCAKCIVTSYLVELNPHCPVKGCGKCVDPKQKQPTPPLEILTAPSTAPPSPPSTPPPAEVECCVWCGKNTLCDCNEEIRTAHHCGDWMCPGDCGVLWCGCIDQCRGRCGISNDSDRWRW